MDYKNTYIVTGATGGIGKSIVDDLVLKGVNRVVLACRNLLKANEIISTYKDVPIELIALPLDLESFDSVRNFCNLVMDAGFRVKGLIHNAGTMPGKVKISIDGFESATQTNFLSPVLLTELLLPSIECGGSIVFTTSITRKIARFRNDWDMLSKQHHNRFVTYGRSKKMLTAYALMLSHRLTDKGIKVNCTDPWIVDTNIITMDNMIIDALSSKFVRPLIYTPHQGASSAIQALDSDDTSKIFTLKKSKPIPRSYESGKSIEIIKNGISMLV